MSPALSPANGHVDVSSAASADIVKAPAPLAALKKKPNAFHDTAEDWRKNIRSDTTFVTDSNGQRPDWYWTGKSPSNCPGVLEDGTITHLQLPNVADFTRQQVLDYFDNFWTTTEILFSGLQGEEVFYRPPYHNLRHPLIFYYGHPAALYVNKLRVAGILSEPVNPYFENIFETGVDEMSWDDLSKNDMMWPSVREVTEYRRTVYNLVKGVILNHPAITAPVSWDSPGWALFMAFEHEGIHVETSSVLMRELPANLVQKPVWWPSYHSSVTPADMAFMCNYPTNEMISVPSGDAAIGKPLGFPSYGWDNEYGSRQFHVREFRASKFCISNGEFLEFVKDGGYRNKSHWTEDGWMWRTFRNAKKPTFWEWDGPQGLCKFKLRLIFEVVDLPLALPAVVNLHEAKAFCNWRSGKDGLTGIAKYRLLSEPEHHRLRDVDAPDAKGQPTYDPVMFLTGEQMRSKRNSNMAYGAEAAVDAFPATSKGFHDVFGNVWQWCEDHFAALPSSHGVHIMYDDFSTPCYDGEHSLIMGSSFASTGDLASVFARFHFRPHFFQHAGFRMVSSAAPLQTSCMDSPGPHVNNWDPSTTKRKATSQEALEAAGSQLVLHYGSREQTFAGLAAMPEALTGFTQQLAQRLVAACNASNVSLTRCLDVGCSVGGTALELARSFESVTAIDLDAGSIKLANQMKAQGLIAVHLKEEGLLGGTATVTCTVPEAKRRLATFRQMDPCCIAPDMLDYDAVVMVNLLERCASPKTPLGRLVGQQPLVRIGGLVLVASTFNWQEDVADKKLWLGGFEASGAKVSSSTSLREFLEPKYDMVEEFDLPYAIRKSARAFDLQVTHVLVMRRRC